MSDLGILDIIKRSRSYRRFYQEKAIPQEELLSMIEAARFSPSARNVQPIKYIICSTPESCARVYPTLAWAGYLKDWDGPAEGERPSAYIIQLHDTEVSPGYNCDHGITAQSILLQATSLGYGGCLIAAVQRESLTEILQLPEHLKIINVIALGIPKEEIVVTDIKNNDHCYWRDNQAVHYVPKRTVEEILTKII